MLLEIGIEVHSIRCSSRSFAHKVGVATPGRGTRSVAPIGAITVAGGLSTCIQDDDRKIEELASEKYGTRRYCPQLKGVGPITALARC